MCRKGFSLVELAVVLVIIGLLIGGIMAGASMIRNGEVKSIITDYAQYKNAITTFRDKYAGLPGDLIDATNYWGVKASTGSDVTCHQTPGTGDATCNGNGNGFMETIAGDASYGERFLVWQQLKAAGLIEGQYTGASTTPPTLGWQGGVNLPIAKVGNGLWIVHQLAGTVTANANWFDGTYPGNAMALIGQTGNPLKPEEAWDIDTKLDDGKPSTGRIFTYKSTSTWGANCATTDVVSTAAYNLSDSNKRCSLVFWLE